MTSEEKREYNRRYREAHKEELKAYQKAYQKTYQRAYCAAHYEERKAKRKVWADAHREEIRAKQRAYRAAHRKELNAQRREYYELNKEKVLSSNKANSKRMEARLGEKYSQKYRREHPDYMREYNKKNKAYQNVRCVTNNAIKSGKLVRLPCEHCGEQQSEAHHIDYNKPLEVMWLCKRCHGEWHRNHTAIPPKES